MQIKQHNVGARPAGRLSSLKSSLRSGAHDYVIDWVHKTLNAEMDDRMVVNDHHL